MADSDLRSLRDRLRRTLEHEVAALSEEASESDFVAILGSVGALKQLAVQLVDVDRRSAALHRSVASADGAAAATLSARLDELASTRSKLVEALNTLTREMER
ncbi:MAG: hypothetical protein H6737_19790 [Alphaproteobacteria bacterium]|nr:hypothetical protein [Alphaproteobacteria bacterium]